MGPPDPQRGRWGPLTGTHTHPQLSPHRRSAVRETRVTRVMDVSAGQSLVAYEGNGPSQRGECPSQRGECLSGSEGNSSHCAERATRARGVPLVPPAPGQGLPTVPAGSRGSNGRRGAPPARQGPLRPVLEPLPAVEGHPVRETGPDTAPRPPRRSWKARRPDGRSGVRAGRVRKAETKRDRGPPPLRPPRTGWDLPPGRACPAEPTTRNRLRTYADIRRCSPGTVAATPGSARSPSPPVTAFRRPRHECPPALTHGRSARSVCPSPSARRSRST